MLESYKLSRLVTFDNCWSLDRLFIEKGAEEVEEEKPPEPQGPPEPEPGSEDWEYVDQPIEVVCILIRFYS